MNNSTGLDGLILCGGKASRLKGVNGDLPKCLLKVHDRSVLGHLIYWLSPKLDRITISYFRDSQLFVDTLQCELDENILAKVQYENDPFQEGTASAVQRYQGRPGQALIIINGDTLYDDASTITPESIGVSEVVFSTSYQAVDRAGEIIMNKDKNTIEYSKNRDGGVSHKGWVTNGILGLGTDAFDVFRNVELRVGDSLENCLLDLQYDDRVQAVLHNSSSKFMDIGVPEEFLNADESFTRLSRPLK
jgi:NDP-sugar pyrophosphorylase family protein